MPQKVAVDSHARFCRTRTIRTLLTFLASHLAPVGALGDKLKAQAPAVVNLCNDVNRVIAIRKKIRARDVQLVGRAPVKRADRQPIGIGSGLGIHWESGSMVQADL